MTTERLGQAIELVKLGKTQEARELLELIIKDERSNISAWQWYAETWSKSKDKIRVWELCLRYNPSNEQAQQALSLLRNDQPRKLKTEQVIPLEDNQAKSFPWLLWASLGLLIIAAGLGIYILKGLQPKDPAKYHHTQPVDYYLYVPKAYKADREWPLFVGIHGSGGTGLDCWNMWQSYADNEGFILLCPSIPGDASGFYQDVGETTVWSAIGAVQKDYHVKRRMFFNGFSAGAYFILL